MYSEANRTKYDSGRRPASLSGEVHYKDVEEGRNADTGNESAGRRSTVFSLVRFKEGLSHVRRATATPTGQVEVGARVEKRVGRRLDAVDARNGIKNDFLLFRGVVFHGRCEFQGAEVHG